MEGRAIARPNPRATPPSATSAVALQWRAGQLPGQTAVGAGVDGGQPVAFNGGPGNCPAKPSSMLRDSSRWPVLQWRAGQLPGQTPAAAFVYRGWQRHLQWRAGQLPGQTRPRLRRGAHRHAAFNGGPGNCPAKRRGVPCRRRRAQPSMEGRAIARPNPPWGCNPPTAHHPSMEGRAIARPNWDPAEDPPTDVVLQWRAGQLPGQTTKQR